MLASAPLAGWAWFAHKLPDAVHVDLGEYASPVSKHDDDGDATDRERLARGEGAAAADFELPAAEEAARDPQGSDGGDRRESNGAKRKGVAPGKRNGSEPGRARY